MNKQYQIIPAKEENYSKLLEIWEDSVKATHFFLKEADIQSIKSFVPKYLREVVIYVYVNNSGEIEGFIGVDKNKIEMLFIHSKSRGKGIGKKLADFAINNLNTIELDVNEQNPQAVDFYKHIGFKVVGRSEQDGMGKPFPLLHMQLSK